MESRGSTLTVQEKTKFPSVPNRIQSFVLLILPQGRALLLFGLIRVFSVLYKALYRLRSERKSFAVFFFPNTSLQILDEFIDEAYEGCFSMVPDGDVCASTCILEPTDLDSIAHGSRKPM
jgi:hypothetical protein